MACLPSNPCHSNLITSNPAIHTVKDFSDKDRIAVQGVKISAQALVLEMAAAQAFGEENYAKLDPLTIQMSHPDALAALLSGHSEITAHLGVAPFQNYENGGQTSASCVQLV